MWAGHHYSLFIIHYQLQANARQIYCATALKSGCVMVWKAKMTIEWQVSNEAGSDAT